MLSNLKKNYLLLIYTFLLLYFFFNFLGGERGLISYIEKKKTYKELVEKEGNLKEELENLKHKINLITSNDLDYLDMLYREKLRYGAKDEILIKLK